MKAACALLCAGLASTATAFMPAAAPRALRPATALAATKIGVFGGGVVGGGVCEIITKKAKALANAAGNAVEVKTVCVRSLDRDRDWEVPAGTTLVDSYVEGRCCCRYCSYYCCTRHACAPADVLPPLLHACSCYSYHSLTHVSGTRRCSRTLRSTWSSR